MPGWSVSDRASPCTGARLLFAAADPEAHVLRRPVREVGLAADERGLRGGMAREAASDAREDGPVRVVEEAILDVSVELPVVGEGHPLLRVAAELEGAVAARAQRE